MKTIIIDIHY